MTLQVIPGAVGGSTSRILVISDAASISVKLRAGRPLADHPHSVQDVPLDADLANALGKHARGHPFRAWLATADALTADCALSWNVVAGVEERTVQAHTLPNDRLTLVSASCFYGGFAEPSNRFLRHVQGLARDNPRAHAKLMTGDNVYLDVHQRTQDKHLWDGMSETAWVYYSSWLTGTYGAALRHLPTLVTWDDHELWNNYPEKQWWLSRSKPPLKDEYERAGRAAVYAFQAPLNHFWTVDSPHRSGVWDTPVASFFFADIRTDRKNPGTDAKMLPEDDLKALEQWAESLCKQPGVLVLGQPLCIEPGGHTDYTPPDFSAQFARIWKALHNAPWDLLSAE